MHFHIQFHTYKTIRQEITRELWPRSLFFRVVQNVDLCSQFEVYVLEHSLLAVLFLSAYTTKCREVATDCPFYPLTAICGCGNK